MSDARRVVFERRASRDLDRIDDWWRANRQDSPDLFLNELQTMLSILAAEPGIGNRARSTTVVGLRRLLLPRTGYFVYYQANDEEVVVLAVWHASRGHEPAL